MNIDYPKFILMCTACLFLVVTRCTNQEGGSHKPEVCLPLRDSDARLHVCDRRCTALPGGMVFWNLLCSWQCNVISQLLSHSTHYILIHADCLTGGILNTMISSGIVWNTFSFASRLFSMTSSMQCVNFIIFKKSNYLKYVSVYSA